MPLSTETAIIPKMKKSKTPDDSAISRNQPPQMMQQYRRREDMMSAAANNNANNNNGNKAEMHIQALSQKNHRLAKELVRIVFIIWGELFLFVVVMIE